MRRDDYQPVGFKGVNALRNPQLTGRSLPESRVVHAVWEKLGGTLIEEFPVASDRPRFLDGVIISTNERQQLPAYNRVPLAGEQVTIVQAKSGRLDMGALGQALFACDLVEREHPSARITCCPAAVEDDLMLRQVVSESPLGRPLMIEIVVGLPVLRSSGHANGPATRGRLLAWLRETEKGLLVFRDGRRRAADWANIICADSGRSVQVLTPTALLLPQRESATVTPDVRLKIDADEEVTIVHTCDDLYMTFMGYCLFSALVARQHLGLHQARGLGLFSNDNVILRSLLEPYRDLTSVQRGPSARA